MTGFADPLTFGVFMPPYHEPGHHTALAIENDLTHVEVLDRLGFDQVWFGEHHSGGYEIYPSPELMIAAAAQRTSRIRLGTGVISLPYHHPLMVADRISFLDHMTRGRAVFGFGPGALPADSKMMGQSYGQLRERMEESLVAILRLFDDDEPVTMTTDWFELRDAQLQLGSFRRPRPELAVASSLSPSGPRLAGRHGLGLLSIGGTGDAMIDILGSTWDVVTEQALAHDQTIDRSNWSIVGMMHLADTKASARDQTRCGLKSFYEYRHAALPEQLYQEGEDLDHEAIVDRVNETGGGVIGTPAEAIGHITMLQERTGGFGTYLITATDWATTEDTRRSWELFMREVAPHFDGSSRSRQRAFEWTKARKPELLGNFMSGVQKAKDSYAAEQKTERATHREGLT